MNGIDDIVNLIKENRSFLVVSHENPDCDALGSTLGMVFVLRDMGKDAIAYNSDEVPSYLRFLPGSSFVTDSFSPAAANADAIIVVDCADISRPGKEFENFVSKTNAAMAFIDHHATNRSDSKYRLVDENASCTAALIYRIIKRMGLSISLEIAECLFSGIVGDTGSFRYSNTSAGTFEIAAELVKGGADPEKISRCIYDNQPIRKIRLRALAMKTLEVDEDGKTAFLHVSKEMFELTDTKKEHAEGIVSIARSIEGVEVAVFCRQEPNSEWKISLRSKRYVDVARIASRFGGGGHRKAAGCNISAPLEKVKSELRAAIREEI